MKKLLSILTAAVLAISPIGYIPFAFATTCVAGTVVGSNCQVELTTGAGTVNQSWTVPSDYSATVKIECIGSGGTPATGQAVGSGGGAYAAITSLSLTPGNTVTYTIGASATTTGTFAPAKEAPVDTYFNGAASTTSSLTCDFGRNGSSLTAGAAGSTANSIGTTKNAGGAGGGTNASNGGNGGGGGSAGSTGVGKNAGGANIDGGGGGGSNGGTSTAGTSGTISTGGNGGQGTNGTGQGTGSATTCVAATFGLGGGGGGGGSSGNGCAGAIDQTWDSTHGAGGGGGGASGNASVKGGNGGTYGGGGGGGGAGAGATGGTGGQGIIVITYTPAAAAALGAPTFNIIGGFFNIIGGFFNIKGN